MSHITQPDRVAIAGRPRRARMPALIIPACAAAVHLLVRAVPGYAGWCAAAAIRTAYPEDLAALGDFFAGLSARTRYLRFFGPVTPSPALLRQLCGLADTIDAMVAVRGGIIVGHAMAVDRTDPGGARVTDIGVVVADAWQGRGLGSALMRALVTRARARGVTLLEMDVLNGNRQVIDMITSYWPEARVERSADSISIRIRLQQHQQQQTTHWQDDMAAPGGVAAAPEEGLTAAARGTGSPGDDNARAAA